MSLIPARPVVTAPERATEFPVPGRTLSRLHIAKGKRIADRYEVVRRLGAGVSGVVYSAKDTASRLVVAVKLISDPPDRLSDPTPKEETMYNRLAGNSDPAVNLFPRLFGSGYHGQLRYLAFELGGLTLLDVVNTRSLHPLPRRHLRKIAIQLVAGLHFLHGLGIVHADIKPNNVVLRSSETLSDRRMGNDHRFASKTRLASVELFIIDLSESVLIAAGEGHGRVGADCYRAPEVTVGAHWSYGVDAFATGCVLAELTLGGPLFRPSGSDIARLALLEQVLGPFPITLAKYAEKLRPGTFAIGVPPRVRFPPPTASSEIVSEKAVGRVLTAMPLTRVIYDRAFLQLCDWLLDLDLSAREDISECYALDFLLDEDEEFVHVEPYAQQLAASYSGWSSSD